MLKISIKPMVGFQFLAIHSGFEGHPVPQKIVRDYAQIKIIIYAAFTVLGKYAFSSIGCL